MNAITQITVEKNFFDDWTAARKLLLPAMNHFHGFYDENDVIAGLLAGIYRLWLWADLAIVTEIIQFPRIKALNFFLIGGDLGKQWEERESDIIQFAISSHCTRIMGRGRKEWNAAASRHGYNFDCVSYYRDI